jgi:hypothetical protein
MPEHNISIDLSWRYLLPRVGHREGNYEYISSRSTLSYHPWIDYVYLQAGEVDYAGISKT